MSKATMAAARKMREGMSPGLAIAITAREFALPRSRLARELGLRAAVKKRTVRAAPPNAWWNR